MSWLWYQKMLLWVSSNAKLIGEVVWMRSRQIWRNQSSFLYNHSWFAGVRIYNLKCCFHTGQAFDFWILKKLTKPGVFNLTEGFQTDLSGHASSFISGSTQRCYGRAGVLSACELSSEAQRAAIHQAVMDFTLVFMSSLAGREREQECGREK